MEPAVPALDKLRAITGELKERFRREDDRTVRKVRIRDSAGKTRVLTVLTDKRCRDLLCVEREDIPEDRPILGPS